MINSFTTTQGKNANYSNQNDGEIISFQESAAGNFTDENNGIFHESKFNHIPVFLQPANKEGFVAELMYKLQDGTSQRLCYMKFQKGKNGENNNILVGRYSNGAMGTMNIKIVKNQNVTQEKPAHRFIYANLSFGSTRKNQQGQQQQSQPQQNSAPTY